MEASMVVHDSILSPPTPRCTDVRRRTGVGPETPHLHPLEQLSGRALLDAIGASRFDPKSTRGFYESYFVRANHPSEPKAFWIRYTLFCPRGRSQLAVGQLCPRAKSTA